jgi:hypothetical protein
MKLNRRLVISWLVVIVLASTFLSGHIVVAQDDPSDEFEVHEWGIFLKNYDCTYMNQKYLFPSSSDCNYTSVLTESPSSGLIYYFDPNLIIDRKPVIYFHSPENLADVTVKVSSIRNAIVIPHANVANVENEQISWYVSIVNNSIVVPNGTKYPYLFYEGDSSLPPAIIAKITTSSKNVTFYIKNIAEYTISDIYFIYGYPGESYHFTSPHGLTSVQIDKLEPNEEQTITTMLSSNFSYNTSEMLSSLIENGLTVEEAQELIDYWEDYWFYPGRISSIPSTLYETYSRILYTIPQSVYDQLLPLTITPQPDVTKRIGIFTITGLPIINEDKLQLRIDTDKDVYSVGEPVNISVTVVNQNSYDVQLNMTGNSTYNIYFYNSNNTLIYGSNYWDVWGTFIIPANSEKTIIENYTWNQIDSKDGTQVPAGTYKIHAGIYDKNLQNEKYITISSGIKEESKTPGFELIPAIFAIIAFILFWKRKTP